MIRSLRPALRSALAAAAMLAAGSAAALHFDVALRTNPGPVAGARIVTDVLGDLPAGSLPVDGETGLQVFPGYFGDVEGGPYLTDDPGFQAPAGSFLRNEVLAFRALGTLRWWNPQTQRWSAAPQGVQVVLYGNIPPEVEAGYDADPERWRAQYEFWRGGTRFGAGGIQGPLAASIDAAGRNGSLHAHLDWRVVADGGAVPPVGAYQVTLQFWSTASVNGAPKYVPSAPVQIVFERGISEAQLAAAVQARVLARAPEPGEDGARLPRAAWAAPLP